MLFKKSFFDFFLLLLGPKKKFRKFLDLLRALCLVPNFIGQNSEKYVWFTKIILHSPTYFLL